MKIVAICFRISLILSRIFTDGEDQWFGSVSKAVKITVHMKLKTERS